jgi:hypothetical protein
VRSFATALRAAEARKVDRDDVRLFGEHRPEAFEGVQALWPRVGEDDGLVAISVAPGDTNFDAVDGLITDGDGVHAGQCRVAGARFASASG